MKVYVKAFSSRRSEIRQELHSISKQIDKHIIRLLIYPTNSLVKHWKHEIWTFQNDIDRLKGTNKYPSSNFIFDALAVHNDITDNLILIVKETEYELTPQDISVGAATAALVEYQTWLADNLSKYGVVRHKEVEDKLDEIMQNYVGK